MVHLTMKIFYPREKYYAGFLDWIFFVVMNFKSLNVKRKFL